MILVALRRLLSAIPVLFIVSLISFGLMRLIPGDPAASIAGPSATPAQIDQLRRDLGLDEPLLMQLLHYYQGLLQGDFGKSLLLGKGVLAAWNDMNSQRDPAVRQEAFARMQRLVLERAYAYPFGSLTTVQASRANVKGFAPFRIPRFSNVWIER